MKVGGKQQALLTAVSLIVLVLTVVTLAVSGNRNAAIAPGGPSPDDAQQILIHGLRDQDITITLGDLKKLPTVTRYAEATRSNGEEVQVLATGPLLDTLLKKYGKSQQEFSRIRFTARDNYAIAVPADILKNCQIVLSYINDGKPLEEDWQPVRVVIPGARSMYWVKDMIRIDLETGADRTPATKLVFLDTVVNTLPQADYGDYGSPGKVVRIRNLIAQYGGGSSVQNVFIEAGDGLEKNETVTNFLSGYIKISGAGAPKFLAPGLPEGMTIRGMLTINYGATAFFDYAEGLDVLPGQAFGRHAGIAFSDIVKQTGLTGANDYLFTQTDGGSVMVATTDMGNGLVYEDAEGALAFTSSGAAGPVNIDNLLSIEPVT
jgi:hypothetical protein